VNLLKMGAYDYISKSEDIKDRLTNTVKNIRNGIGLKREISTLRREVQKKYSFRDSILGESQAIKIVYDRIDKALSTNITVIISGETGTGKELVAKAIHYNSKRKDKSFVTVNVSAIPSELIESELFGHEKGSFTSAIKQRIGKFEQANGGTLFLDEIGDMSLNAQAKVLRALQEGKITRVGADKDISVDVRVIAATNKDLLKEVDEKTFRLDLYHRLGVIIIHVPSLNERRDDVPHLVEYFLELIATEYGQPKKTIDKNAMEALKRHDWTGNIRELRNVVERLIILSGKTISVDDVESFVLPKR
jgi:DNA-binding NtrC family response regulator